MTINLSVPQTMQELRPRITVVGVGGAGCNAVNNMISADLDGVDFLVANTDGQALAHSLANRKIQLGSSITQGLGAGSKPEIGRAAAEESLDDVMAELADCNMVFITAGMGGGTGTGAAPVIARAARERGILTVGVITKPFEFEGQRRMNQAETGIEELQAHVDTLIIIPNQNLFRLANERTTFADAFHMADTVLHQGVCGVTDLMIKPGMINLDFADIRAVMSEMGKAMMGTGEASGESRAIDAAEASINNPLLDDTTMKGANAVLINVTGGMDMTLFEVDEAANRIRKEVEPDAVIIFGSAFDEKLEGIMRVSVVATGIDTQSGVMSRPVRAMQTMAVTPPQTSTIITPLSRQSADEVAQAAASEEADAGEDDKQIDLSEAVNAATMSTATSDILDDNDEAQDAGDIGVTGDTGKTGETAETSETVAQDSTETPEETGSENPEEETAPTASDDVTEIMTTPLVADKADDLLLPKALPKQKSFIPPAAAKMPEEVSVPTTSEAPTSRPSLINKISGLWSNKPENTSAGKIAATNAETDADNVVPSLSLGGTKSAISSSAGDDAKGEQPASPAAERTSSILDLPRGDLVQHGSDDTLSQRGLTTDAQGTLDGAGDDLDIPAFLRRQAN